MISIVTITFNNHAELLATLETSSNIVNTEIVVINGGSDQETLKFLENNASIKGFSGKDEGISDAFNIGVSRASGEFVTFLNSGDQLIDRDYYIFANNYFTQNPHVDYMYADIIFDHKTHGKLTVTPNENIGKTPFAHPSLIARRSVIQKLGGFDKKLKIAMDYDFMCKLIQGRYQGYYYTATPVVLMDGKGVSSNNGLKGIAEREYVLKKYNLITNEAYVYLKILILKNHARNILGKMRLLKLYDFFRNKFRKIKAE